MEDNTRIFKIINLEDTVYKNGDDDDKIIFNFSGIKSNPLYIKKHTCKKNSVLYELAMREKNYQEINTLRLVKKY